MCTHQTENFPFIDNYSGLLNSIDAAFLTTASFVIDIDLQRSKRMFGIRSLCHLETLKSKSCSESVPMIYLTIPDMACSACADAIQQAISTLDPQAVIESNLDSKQVQVSTHCSEAAIRQAIASAGYTPS